MGVAKIETVVSDTSPTEKAIRKDNGPKFFFVR